MNKKVKPIASKAQAKHFYDQFKKGKISYPDLMKSVHVTDFSKIPDRVAEKKAPASKKKVTLAVKGLI